MSFIRATAVLAAGLLGLGAGCTSTGQRIAERQQAFAAAPAAVQEKVKAGVVEHGYSSALVYIALGKPQTTTSDANGNEVWVYRREPITAHNERVSGGFVRRTVYDPVKRANDVVIERVDARTYPHLVPRTVRITFRQDHVIGIEEFRR